MMKPLSRLLLDVVVVVEKKSLFLDFFFLALFSTCVYKFCVCVLHVYTLRGGASTHTHT